MTTPTDLAQALRELIPYAAECAACPSYRIKNARAALLHAHESRAQPASVADGLVDRLTAAMREADETFQRVGGSTRHYVRDCLLPILWMHGITVAAAPQPPAKESE